MGAKIQREPGNVCLPLQPGRVSFAVRLGRAHLAVAPRAFCCAVAGLVLDAGTVIVCLLNAISVQQAIAMALPAALITAVGVIGLLVPDPWTAWRRGFQHGCAAAARCEACQGAVNVTPPSVRHPWLDTLAGTHAPGRHRTPTGRRGGFRGINGHPLGGWRWGPVAVHVLDSEQRENLRDRCLGRVGDPPDRGHGRGFARQAFGSEKGMNHLVAVTSLPHPDKNPAGEALP
jgi:hypothetical protein